MLKTSAVWSYLFLPFKISFKPASTIIKAKAGAIKGCRWLIVMPIELLSA
ncbi:MAG: hypothetical protein K9M44_03690 [Candidatus Pacebacteria bacterium]|nr:hypothetical protein [Candidatus Paceibacterota bacterium]